MPRRMLQMFIVSNVYLVYLLFHWYYPWYYPWQLFWRWDKCCKCLSYQIFILQIFYCTDIFPWQMFWRRGKCCKCLSLSCNFFYFAGSYSDDETNVANFYIANLFWRWNKCCKCLYCKCCKSYQILILQIFYCTDIFLAIVLTMRQAERVLRLTGSKARSQRRNTRRRRNNFELSLDFLWICVNFCPTVHGLKLWWWQHWRICAMHWPSLRTKNLIIAFLHSKPETCHNMMICIN